MPNARVTTITTALSGDPPKELRFFGFAYKVPVGELDPAWPRTLTALTQKAPTTDGRRWRLAPGVDIERIETLDAETGENHRYAARRLRPRLTAPPTRAVTRQGP